MNKKIIFLFTPGPIGGAERIVIHGVKSLLDFGMNVELWTIKETRAPSAFENFQKELNKLGILTKVYSSSKVIDLKLVQNLKKDFISSSPAIIHAHGFKAAFYGKITAPTNTKYIITHHGKTGHTLKVKLYETLEELIMKRSNAVIAVSLPMKLELIDAGIKKDKIYQIDNFMTAKVLTSKEIDILPLKLLFVGRLSPEKGCSVLIHALKNIKDQNLKLTVVGDGIERADLEKLTKINGLQDIVEFIGFQSNVSDRMTKSHALVIPSFKEGLPLTLIEATCMGLPVIASKVGGIPCLVHHNKNGFLVNAGNPAELAEAILKMSKNYRELKRTADEIKAEMTEKFSAKTWTKKTLQVYNSVLIQL